MIDTRRHTVLHFGLALLALAIVAGCSDETTSAPPETLQATIGPEGGVLEGAAGTQLEGVRVDIPEGALAETATLTVTPTSIDDNPLPAGAFGIGAWFEIEGATLALPARVTVPYDPERLQDFDLDPAGVKVWRLAGQQWNLATIVDVSETDVTAEMDQLSTIGPGVEIE